MKRIEFDYHLPPELIAQYPAERRADARLLLVRRETGEISDRMFRELPELIETGYFLVLNDSKVFKARLMGHRGSGGRVEVFLVRERADGSWTALLRPSGRVKKGEPVYFDGGEVVFILDEPGGPERLVRFESAASAERIIARFGQVPLPPYIRRPAGVTDLERYQTVYARVPGSVAAPTAGLHFDDAVLDRLDRRGVAREYLTLHVGPGTFKPVMVEEVSQHRIEPEFAEISSETAAAINRRRGEGKKLLAVGTTVVRTLEAAATNEGTVAPYAGMVDLFIHPPFSFRAVDAMLTNFHLPQSSLLMLVSAYCGHARLMEVYGHAVEKKYRFYSYGDCMLIV